MQSIGLMWRERQSTSRLVESVWESSTPAGASRMVIADPCISISLVKNKDLAQVVVMGPKTRPRNVKLAPGYGCRAIRLKPGVFFKHLSTQVLADSSLTFSADAQSRFWFDDSFLQFPSFHQAELFIDELYKKGLLGYEDPNDQKAAKWLSFRTQSRHTQRVTGLSPYQLYQLTRMHKALRLLKQGMSAVDVAAELGFVDQSHLIRASKRFLGRTLKHFSDLPQIP